MMRAAVEKAGLSKEAAREAIVELERVGRLTVLGEGSVDPQSETIVTTSEGWQELIRRMQHVLSTYHAANPLRSGIPREELKSRMKMDSRVFSAAIETASRQGLILDRGQRLSLPEHQVHLTREQRARAEALRARFRASPFSPPSVKECLEELGEELWAHLLETGEFTQLTPEVVLESSVYDSMVREIRQRLASGGTLTVAQVRDQFNTSRKYALALMEHLDAIGVTVREGDVRRLARSAAGDSRQG
jgi:selenocysteine-specific elongation factor